MGGAHRLSPAAAETPGTRLLSARENSLASGASSGYGAAFASLKPSLPPSLPAASSAAGAPDGAPRQGSEAFPRMRLSPKLRSAPPPPSQRASPSSSGFRSGPPAPLVGLGKPRPAAPRPRVSPLLAPAAAPRAPPAAPLAATTNVVTHHHHHHYAPAPGATGAPHVCSTEAVFADQATAAAARGLRSPPRGTKTPAATRALYTPREERRPVPRSGGGGAVEWVPCPETVAALQRMGVRDGGVDDPARLALRSMQPVWNGQVAVGLDYGGGAANDARRTPYVLPAAEAEAVPPPSGPVQVVDYSEDLSPMPEYSQGYGAAAEAVLPHSPYPGGEGGDPTAVEVVKQLFYLRGVDDSHHTVMAPWTDNPPLLDDVLKLVTKKVPVTRFGLRTPPETRLFTIVSFRDNEKRMVPWLVWLEQDPRTGELQMRDRCPLDALVSFKAGKWCQESPGFAPYLKAAPGGGERAIVVREDEQQALASDTRGCMVLEFTKRLVEVHCDHREDWRSLVNVFRNVVKINTAARRYAKVLQQGGPPSPHGLADPSAQQPFYGSEQQGLQRVDTVPKAGRI